MLLFVLVCCCGLPALGWVLVRFGRMLRRRGRRRYSPNRKAQVTAFCPASVAPQFSLTDEDDSPVVHGMVFDLAEMGLELGLSRDSLEVACDTGFREAALEVPPTPSSSPDSEDEVERYIPLGEGAYRFFLRFGVSIIPTSFIRY